MSWLFPEQLCETKISPKGNFTKKNPAYGRYLLSQRVQLVALCQKTKEKIFGSDLEHLPIFKALRESNPEQLLVVKAPRVKSGTTPCF